MAAIETDGRVSVFTGADGNPTMPQLNADGSISTSPGRSPGNQPVTIADGANVTLGAKSDTAGANAGVANQTAQSRLAGIWGVLGSLTDAAATVWNNTSNTISSLLRGIGGNIAAVITPPGGNPTAVVNVQEPKERVVFCEFTRTADAYTYAPTQLWRAAASGHEVFSAPCAMANGNPVKIIRARLIKSTNVVAGFAATVYLHNVAMDNVDKAVLNLSYANNAKRSAVIIFPFMQIEGAASDCAMSWGFFPQQTETTIAQCDAADTMLYPQVVIEGPYVATASEKLYLELTVR